MTQQFTITGRLPGYNELSSGWHYHARHRVKMSAMEAVGWEIKRQGIQPVEGKVVVTITCYERDRRRDDDNVTSGAAKIILDALKNNGIIAGDGRKYVECVKVPARVDRENPRVEVELRRAE